MRVTLKAINEELGKRGYTARLAKTARYFYFQFGEAAYWLDRTVNVPTVSSLTLQEWIQEFELLKRLNRGRGKSGKPVSKRNQPSLESSQAAGQLSDCE